MGGWVLDAVAEVDGPVSGNLLEPCNCTDSCLYIPKTRVVKEHALLNDYIWAALYTLNLGKYSKQYNCELLEGYFSRESVVSPPHGTAARKIAGLRVELAAINWHTQNLCTCSGNVDDDITRRCFCNSTSAALNFTSGIDITECLLDYISNIILKAATG